MDSSIGNIPPHKVRAGQKWELQHKEWIFQWEIMEFMENHKILSTPELESSSRNFPQGIYGK